MRQQECVAMLHAGGQGSRLGALTKKIAKPAVAFGGKYRIIDFSLSNCTNSNINTVGVLTQYKPLLLNSYISTGAAWDLDDAYGGVFLLPTRRKPEASGTRGLRTQSFRISTLLTTTLLSMSWLFPAITSTKWITA